MEVALPEHRTNAALPDAMSIIEFACPRCRARVELGGKSGGLRCPACGYEFREVGGILSFATSQDVNEWQAFFEGRSAAHDRETSAANDYRSPLQQQYIIEGFRRACGPFADLARVLDAGCGNGLFWAVLSGKPNVVGVDYSLGMCALARARGMRVYHADATALPFVGEQFDLIYSAEILQCVSNLSVLMTELARVCRTDGRVVVSTLNRRSVLRRAMRQVRKLMPHTRAPTHTSAILRTAAEVAAVGRSSSLAVRSVRWVHFPFPWLRSTPTEYYPLEPMATNMIVEFVKLGPAAHRQR